MLLHLTAQLKLLVFVGPIAGTTETNSKTTIDFNSQMPSKFLGTSLTGEN
jgi:hypothetical protein